MNRSDLLPNIGTDDIYATSDWMDQIFQQIADGSIVAFTDSTYDLKPNNHAKGRSLAIPITSDTVNTGKIVDGQGTVTSLYEKLLYTWVAPLQVLGSSRARLALEKRVRKLSIDLHLSFYSLQCDPIASLINRPLESAETLREIELPVRHKTSTGFAAAHKVRNVAPVMAGGSTTSDSPHAMQPASQVSEGRSGPQSPKSDLSVSTPIYAPNERLAIFAEVKDPALFSRSFSSIIEDWEIGVDPAQYSSAYLNRISSIQSDGDGSDIGALQKRRELKKRAKRRASSAPSDSAAYPSSGTLASHSIPGTPQLSISGTTARQKQPGIIRIKKSREQRKRRPGFG
jgi:hypothetical protein